MSGTLISALVLSLVVHAALFIFGPGIRPILIEEIPEDSIEVKMVRREVPIPDALRSKPIPEVSPPEPLDLKRLLIRKGRGLEKSNPKINVEHKVTPPRNISRSILAAGMPRLNMPQPVTPLDMLAFHKKGKSSFTPEEIFLPLGKPGAGKRLIPGKNPLAGLGRGEIRDFEREVSKYALVGGVGTGRQSIRGPAAARRIVFRPPLPIVKNLESSGDIELRFWVLSDGTVGRVVPIRKGSAYLEAIAGNNLRQWRFTALRHDEPPREEWGQIVYRFRIR
jgi:hypothetical protein